MNENEYADLVRQATEAFSSGESEEHVLGKLGEAKRFLTDKALAMNRANILIDSLADNVRPGAKWDFARLEWTVQPVFGSAASQPKAVDRSERVIEIVNAKVAAGETKINTKEIAQQLRIEGDTKPLSSLATAVGNVLSRTEKWQRIKRNVYVQFADV